MACSLALGPCLAGLRDLQRGERDLRLHIGGQRIEAMAAQLPPGALIQRELQLEITVCTDGRHQLDEVLAAFGDAIAVRSFELPDPRLLPLRSRDLLIREGEAADLSLYLEDNLVINDPLFLDKQAWFLASTGGAMVLMPHRHERDNHSGIGVMLIDGPLRNDFIRRFHTPADNRASGSFDGRETIHFDVPANPHAGCFCLNRIQVERLRALALAEEGFVGPLETAATLTVLEHLTVVKPALPQWRFLCLEHAHPAFQGYLERYPIEPLPLTACPPASGADP